MMEAEEIVVERTNKLMVKPRINVYCRMQKWKKVSYIALEKKSSVLLTVPLDNS